MMEPIIEIKEAKYIDGYKIALKFNDGKENIIDFSDFILHSNHPDIKRYKDLELFKSFKLEYGDIQWNDYDLAFPVYDLYQNKIA